MVRRATLPAEWALILWAACSSWASGCDAGTTSVAVQVVTAPGDDPFVGATDLVISIEQAGLSDPVASGIFPITDSRGRLGPLEYGEGFAVRVEATASDVVFARGRSFPFDVTGDEPTVRPHVLVGVLGRFVVPLPGQDLGDEVAGMAVTPEGALIATVSGDVFVYHQHGQDGAATMSSVDVARERAGAAWVDVGGGLLLGVGGAEAGASLFGADGRLLTQSSAAALEDQRQGVALVALPGERAALVVGGARDAAGQPTDAVTLVTVSSDDGALALAPTLLVRLPAPRRDVLAVALTALVDPCPCTRVVVIGGTTTDGAPATAAVMLEPSRPTADEVSLGVAVPTTGASATAIDTGLIVVAGGMDMGAPTSAITLLQVRNGISADQRLSLFESRSGAGVVPFGSGLALVVGGLGIGGAPSTTADLIDVRTGGFLGEVVATQSLPMPAAAPLGVQLLDGSVLVASSSGLALYIPPRGPG
jgi:hypothetical protein